MGNEILLIHLGGLGDVCLSESTFHSLNAHFKGRMHAVGYTRFLGLFESYFDHVLSVEERSWLWLFSDLPCDKRWAQGVMIGKDKDGEMRRRLGKVSAGPVLFIDMYPEKERCHVEEYQLAQLQKHGVTPLKKKIEERNGQRIILYPETGHEKRKWPYDHFITLYHRLNDKGIDVVLLEAPDHEASVADARTFDDLKETASFLSQGGLFFSNDSGVAHLAATCGLATITLFWDHDPVIWHPRGRNAAIECSARSPSVEEMLSLILKKRGPS